MTFQTNLYLDEIFNFIKTCTIKFDPLGELIKNNLRIVHGIDYPEDVNPYYLSLLGEYLPTDTLMHVYSIDIEESYNLVDNTDNINITFINTVETYLELEELSKKLTLQDKGQAYCCKTDHLIYVWNGLTFPPEGNSSRVLFDKDLKYNYPKTASAFRIPNKEYITLCQRYPNQIDLIKAITYPISDISVLENSPPLALVGYESGYLEPNEITIIVEAINSYLDYMYRRWWTKEYSYEELYPISFMALVWQFLPLVIVTQRTKNIKTSAAHSFHVWEYLISHGLEDYRDILSLKQSHWLYRNIKYLQHNKGKMHNLIVLADNLLQEFNITLLGKIIRQQQIDKADECYRTPEILSEIITDYNPYNTMDLTTFETIVQINQKMYTKGIEVKNTLDYIREVENDLGNAEEDRLQTKLLELKKEPIDTRYEAFLAEFLFDSFMYRLAKDNLKYPIKITDEITNIHLVLTVEEATLLHYYARFRGIKEVAIDIPNKVYVRIPYKFRKPNISELPSHIYFSSNREDSVVYDWGNTNSLDEIYKGRNIIRLDSLFTYNKDTNKYISNLPDEPEDLDDIYIVENILYIWDVDNSKWINKGIFSTSYTPVIDKDYSWINSDYKDYPTFQHCDINGILTDIPWDIGPFDTIIEFSNLLAKQFSTMIQHIKEVQMSADWLYTEAVLRVYDKCLDCGLFEVKLTNHDNYIDWFLSNELLSKLYNSYEDLGDNATLYWDRLADNLIANMIPINNEVFTKYTGLTEAQLRVFDKIRSLFIQMSSYNVTFLDTDRSINNYLFLTPYAQLTVGYKNTRDFYTLLGLFFDGNNYGINKYFEYWISLFNASDQYMISREIHHYNYDGINWLIKDILTVENRLIKLEFMPKEVGFIGYEELDINVLGAKYTFNFDDLLIEE